MKKLRDIVINEIGDSSYKFDHRTTQYHTDAYFNSKNGDRYNAFIRNVGHPKYGATADVSFTNNSKDTMDMTGKEGRHAHKVFGTVKNVIKQHLKANPQITHLNFSAKNDNDGRTKLYHAMSKHLDPDYKHEVDYGETQFSVKADKLR